MVYWHLFYEHLKIDFEGIKCALPCCKLKRLHIICPICRAQLKLGKQEEPLAWHMIAACLAAHVSYSHTAQAIPLAIIALQVIG